MKQLIVLLLVVGGGYYLYTHGLSNVLNKANLNPKEFVQEVKVSAASNQPAKASNDLPEVAPERASGLKMDNANMRLVETTIFNTYDSDVCFAYTEMIYASGSTEASSVINKYLSTFTLPEDKNKILPLVTRYKDRQSLKILEDFLKRGTYSRKMLLKRIADYRTPEAMSVIKSISQTPNSPVKDEAEALYTEMLSQTWSTSSTVGKGDKQLGTHRIAGLMHGNPNQSGKGDF